MNDNKISLNGNDLETLKNANTHIIQSITLLRKQQKVIDDTLTLIMGDSQNLQKILLSLAVKRKLELEEERDELIYKRARVIQEKNEKKTPNITQDEVRHIHISR